MQERACWVGCCPSMPGKGEEELSWESGVFAWSVMERQGKVFALNNRDQDFSLPSSACPQGPVGGKCPSGGMAAQDSQECINQLSEISPRAHCRSLRSSL